MSRRSRLQTSAKDKTGERPRAWPKRVKTSGFDSSGIHFFSAIAGNLRAVWSFWYTLAET